MIQIACVNLCQGTKHLHVGLPSSLYKLAARSLGIIYGYGEGRVDILNVYLICENTGCITCARFSGVGECGVVFFVGGFFE